MPLSSITLSNVGHTFSAHDQHITLFENINAVFAQGCSSAIIGPSGAGKSSLLTLMAGMDEPTVGKVEINRDSERLPIQQFKKHFGFVFQQFHLIPEFDALTNVELPLRLHGFSDSRDRALNWLRKVGMAERQTHFPGQLSGGEQQRVALARALCHDPKFIFADEPTGNLDQENAELVAEILFDCCEESKASLILVTHSLDLASKAAQRFELRDKSLRQVS